MKSRVSCQEQRFGRAVRARCAEKDTETASLPN